jgi:thioredoxin-related protein
MDTVTYPDPKTASTVQQFLVPLRVDVSGARDLSVRFDVKATPTVITLDGEGNELNRSMGFQPPNEFLPSLLLGIGKSYVNAKDYSQALSALQQLVDDYPDSSWSAEAGNLRQLCLKKTGR